MHNVSPRRLRLPDAPPLQQSRLADGAVAVWQEALLIDTYEPAPPERLPMFFDRRVYQGSSGRVYPLPFTERVASVSRERSWNAVHLENEWVRLVILPELGGRIHVGHDKTVDYDFFYRNSVIKPALVGLAGSWVSGGVEFNWPQHHRPGTFLPMCTHIEEEADGAVTVWMSDHDPFARMKGMHGIRLRPDSSVIELRARLHNRTEQPQTFLWWANVAARAHEQYQSFFPTDVRYVADHARRAITAFPRADRPYYGVDYPERVDDRHPDADRIDFYSNIPVPTSYMVVETRDDFFGGYDHEARAGFVHWADRRIAPGKKQWTWGNAPFGHAWDDHLTDEDGPYVELMAGVYTDNQPDFAYLAPGETKTFSQYWYPITEIGPAHQATRDAAISVQLDDGEAKIGVASSRVFDAAVIEVSGGGETQRFETALAPGQPFIATVLVSPAVAAHDLTVRVEDDGRTLIEWTPRRPDDAAPEPSVATEPPLPGAIDSADELYLTGVHLAQYRHPTRTPEPYWLELLSRDPGDARANIALGAASYRRGEYENALGYFFSAIARLTHRNPNPADGEAHYRLGLTLQRLGRLDAAYDAFAKAAWDVRWAHPANLRMGVLDAAVRRDADALERLNVAARYDCEDVTMLAARVVVLRRLGQEAEAAETLRTARELDPLDALLRVLDGQDPGGDALVMIDIAGDLGAMGEIDAALSLLEDAAARPATGAGGAAPIAEYLAAALLDDARRDDEAAAARERARLSDATYAFPSGLGAFDALQRALDARPDDVRALLLLGEWLYDAGRRADARSAWVRAVDAGGADPVLLRNAALSLVEVDGDEERAAQLYDQAVELSDDPRLWYELDQLALRRGVSSFDRLARLEPEAGRLTVRDDLLVVIAELLTDNDRADEALDLLTSRSLQPWEGGEGVAVRALARAAVAAAGKCGPRDAIAVLQMAIQPPASLGETWHPLDSRAPLWFALGRAHDAAGERDLAHDAWQRAVREADASAVEAETLDGVRAARAMDDDMAAERLTMRVAERIRELRSTAPRVDYFATSLPETLLFSTSPQESADRERTSLEHALAGLAPVSDGSAR